MTPEDRHKRVEDIVKMAELGVLVEPAYDREEWRSQQESGELTDVEAPKRKRGAPAPKPARRRTA